MDYRKAKVDYKAGFGNMEAFWTLFEATRDHSIVSSDQKPIRRIVPFSWF
jgi:hypothetical protein